MWTLCMVLCLLTLLVGVHLSQASEDEEDKSVGTVKEGVLYPTFQVTFCTATDPIWWACAYNQLICP
jgi:hypothetical protein